MAAKPVNDNAKLLFCLGATACAGIRQRRFLKVHTFSSPTRLNEHIGVMAAEPVDAVHHTAYG